MNRQASWHLVFQSIFGQWSTRHVSKSVSRQYSARQSSDNAVSRIYAATYPGRVKKIVIVDSTLVATPDRVAVLHQVGGREGRSYATRRDFMDNFRVRPAGTTAAPEILRHLAERSGRQGPDGLWRHKFDRNVYSKRVLLDMPPHWNRIGVPALLVKGGCSDRITPQIVADAKSRCAHVELVEVPGADHHVTLDNPDGFVDAVNAWLGIHDKPKKSGLTADSAQQIGQKFIG
jgi:pimeloyl-ACP methyl ester carboxylesterase